MEKKSLKGLTIQQLESFAVSIGEARFRGRQLFYWIYNRGAASFEEMTDLPKSLRHRLGEIASLQGLSLAGRRVSPRDGTVKYLFELQDGLKIESVLIPPTPRFNGKEKRLTLCISTQVGCPLGCKFCATGAMGFKRNLTAGEIVDQVLLVRKESPRKITNLVYMGMGEPLMNYDEVMKSVEILSNEYAVGISAKRMTISTAGWADNIRRLADERRKVKLAISLHTLDDKLRSKLMPLNRKYNLEELLDSVDYYYKITKERVTFEYIVFDGLNNTDDDVRRLTALAKRIPCKINLIPFHPIDFISPTGFAQTSPERMQQFAEKLRDANITVMVRSSAGEDIEAACGQLALMDHRSRTPRKASPRTLPKVI